MWLMLGDSKFRLRYYQCEELSSLTLLLQWEILLLILSHGLWNSILMGTRLKKISAWVPFSDSYQFTVYLYIQIL